MDCMDLKIEKLSNGYLLHEPSLLFDGGMTKHYYPNEIEIINRISYLIKRDF